MPRILQAGQARGRLGRTPSPPPAPRLFGGTRTISVVVGDTRFRLPWSFYWDEEWRNVSTRNVLQYAWRDFLDDIEEAGLSERKLDQIIVCNPLLGTEGLFWRDRGYARAGLHYIMQLVSTYWRFCEDGETLSDNDSKHCVGLAANKASLLGTIPVAISGPRSLQSERVFARERHVTGDTTFWTAWTCDQITDTDVESPANTSSSLAYRPALGPGDQTQVSAHGRGGIEWLVENIGDAHVQRALDTVAPSAKAVWHEAGGFMVVSGVNVAEAAAQADWFLHLAQAAFARSVQLTKQGQSDKTDSLLAGVRACGNAALLALLSMSTTVVHEYGHAHTGLGATPEASGAQAHVDEGCCTCSAATAFRTGTIAWLGLPTLAPILTSCPGTVGKAQDGCSAAFVTHTTKYTTPCVPLGTRTTKVSRCRVDP